MWVYVIASYGEYGLENPIKATMDENALIHLVKTEFKSTEEETAMAVKFLKEQFFSGQEGTYELYHGWGGPQVYKIKLNFAQ